MHMPSVSFLAARLLTQVKPVYPPEARARGPDGTVSIDAVIGMDGSVLSPRVTNNCDADLAKAALDAVRS